MRRSQGRPFSEQEIKRIKFLLSSTECTLDEIASRMECAKSSFVTINKNFQIRQYLGRRSSWVRLEDASMASQQIGVVCADEN
jgi:hypothetical protein